VELLSSYTIPSSVDEHDFIFQTGCFSLLYIRMIMFLVLEEEKVHSKQKNLQSKPPEFQYATYFFWNKRSRRR